MNRHICIILLGIIPGIVSSQAGILDSYIGKGLESNLSLGQKQSSDEKSMAALKEAKSW